MDIDTDLMTFISRYPHNTDTSDKFLTLVEYAYHKDRTGLSLEQFINKCLNRYGGTVAAALIDYLYNERITV